jgi:hypothetical protein
MIKQCRFSPRVEHFKEGFVNRWNLQDYFNEEEPCVFVGLYDKEDLQAIQEHKGIKILLPTGTLNLKKNQEYIDILLTEKDIFFVKDWWTRYPKRYNVKKINIPMKDYSLFKSNELGDKIYCYLGTQGNKIQYGFKLAEKIQQETSFEIIYGFRDSGKDLPIEKLKTEYYDKCFINLNLSLLGVGGFTSVNELAFMGRKSITTSGKREKFLINFKKEDRIKNIIERESKKIGTIQPSLIDDYFVGDEWLDVDYWIKR